MLGQKKKEVTEKKVADDLSFRKLFNNLSHSNEAASRHFIHCFDYFFSPYFPVSFYLRFVAASFYRYY